VSSRPPLKSQEAKAEIESSLFQLPEKLQRMLLGCKSKGKKLETMNSFIRHGTHGKSDSKSDHLEKR